MPEIRPYDPTDVKNMVVGVADYRKAKAGEAFENLARGLGQVRDQVGANAEQRISGNANLIGQAIGSVAHLAAHTKATNQTQQILNKQKVSQVASNFNLAAGQAARTLQNGPGATNPSATYKTFSEAIDSTKLGSDGKPIVQYNGGAADRKAIMAQARKDPDLGKDKVALAELQTQLNNHANTHLAEMDHWKYNRGTVMAGQANTGFINDGVKTVAQPEGVPATDTGTMVGAIVDTTNAIVKSNLATGVSNEATKLDIQKANQTISHAGLSGQISAQERSDDPVTALNNLSTIQKTMDNRANLGIDLTPESEVTLHGKVEAAVKAQEENLALKANADLIGYRQSLAEWDQWAVQAGQRGDIPSQEKMLGNIGASNKKLDGYIETTTNNPNLSARAKNILNARYVSEKEANAHRTDTTEKRIQFIKGQAAQAAQHKEVLARQAISEQKADARENRRIQHEKEAAQNEVKRQKGAAALTEGFRLTEQMTELNPATQQTEIMRLSAQLSQHAEDNKKYLTPDQNHAMQVTSNKMAKSIAAVKVTPPPFFWPFGGDKVEHLDLTNPKEAQELLQRREAAIATVRKMQKSIKTQQTWAARAAAVKAEGKITDSQEETWNNTVADLTKQWEDGKLTDDALQFKLNSLPAMVAAQKPSLPNPELHTIKGSPPIPLGQMKGVQQAPPAPKQEGK